MRSKFFDPKEESFFFLLNSAFLLIRFQTMLWLLLATCGYAFSCAYHAMFGAETENLQTRSPMPLDPISVAGCLRIIDLLKTGVTKKWKAAVVVTTLRTHPRQFLKQKDLPAQRRVWSRCKYRDHFSDLCNSKVISELKRANHAVSYSSYFSVPKSEAFDRAIFNGRRISKLFKRPNPVNLIQTKELLDRLQRNSTAHVITGDLRHWFHQLDCGDLWRFFGVACDGRSYVWKMFPMGFSWSPFVAQTLAWLLLTHGMEYWLDTSFVNDSELPRLIQLKDGGFMTVYYDNFFISTTSIHTLKAIDLQLRKNFEEFYASVKEYAVFCSGPDIDEIREWRKNSIAWSDPNTHLNLLVHDIQAGFLYLGLHIRMPSPGLTEWRIEQEKIDKLPQSLPVMTTPRQCCAVAGKIISAFTPSGLPLGADPDIIGTIEGLRAAAKHAHTSVSWDTSFSLSSGILAAMNSAWGNLISNSWRSVTAFKATSRVILATDAATYGYGIAILSDTGVLLKQYKRPWTADERNLHIFIREVKAAEKGLELLKTTEWLKEGTEVVLVIDNTATAWAIQRGYTVNTIAMRSISRMIQNLHQLNVCTVVSEDNCADEPSRNKIVNACRVQRTFKAVQDHLIGRRSGVVLIPCAQHADEKEALRHVEEIDMVLNDPQTNGSAALEQPFLTDEGVEDVEFLGAEE